MQHLITDKMVKFIAQWEGFSSKAYWDETGSKWTIGYGHTNGIYGDLVCTKARHTTAALRFR